MKIDVGCGNRRKKGYLGVDKYTKGKAHIKATAYNLPFKSNSIEAIYCSHMIEHVPHPKTEQVFSEFFRVLKSGGKLEILCPDFERMIEMWLEGDYEYRWGIGLIKIFGWERYSGDFHYTGFSKGRMFELLPKHGFEISKIENKPSQAKKERVQFPDGDLYVEAYKK